MQLAMGSMTNIVCMDEILQKKPWNDDSLANTKKQWFPMVSANGFCPFTVCIVEFGNTDVHPNTLPPSTEVQLRTSMLVSPHRTCERKKKKADSKDTKSEWNKENTTTERNEGERKKERKKGRKKERKNEINK